MLRHIRGKQHTIQGMEQEENHLVLNDDTIMIINQLMVNIIMKLVLTNFLHGG